MKSDTLKYYTKLRRQLLEEKQDLEARLQELNQALGTETPASPVPVALPRRRGRPPGRSSARGSGMSLREAVIQALSSGPLARPDLVRAVEGVGYRFKTNKPLNSIGSILYAKDTPVKKTADGRFFIPGSAASPGAGPSTKTNGEAPVQRRKRRVSAEARAKMAAAQKARRAREKSGRG